MLPEWAGHSVNVLLRVYAKCIDGEEEAARRRIEGALGIEPPADADRPEGPQDEPTLSEAPDEEAGAE